MGTDRLQQIGALPKSKSNVFGLRRLAANARHQYDITSCGSVITPCFRRIRLINPRNNIFKTGQGCMKYQYSELSYIQFESLAIHLCFKLLGIGTESFSEGKDGGRDSRFEGTAEIYPSRSDPWKGLTIIQAKHTISYNKKFSDSDFFGIPSSDINLEAQKILKLIKEDNLKNYLLFSNRRLPAIANENIKLFLNSETGLPKENIGLIGIESMEKYLKVFSTIPYEVGLNPFDMPINIEPDELAQIIVAIRAGLKDLDNTTITKPIIRTSFERKNTINNLSEQYAKRIKSKIIEIAQIEEFLAMPENELIQSLYIESSDELSAKIVAMTNKDFKFDIVLERIIDLLIERDTDLKTNKSLTRIMIYYMYYHCEIGENEDAITA